MNTELLTCRRTTAGVVYAPYQLQHSQVNRIYADITERYPFQNLQHLPDGARMFNPNSDFFIQTTRMQINDNVDYFGSTKEKAIDLFKMAQERLNIPQFSTFGIKLTAFLQMDKKQNAAELIDNTVLGAVKNDLKLLGDGRKGVGLRFVLHKEGIHEIRIEPFFNDITQLYVELDVQYPIPFTDLSSIESKMDAAYNYLFGEIKDFLGSLS